MNHSLSIYNLCVQIRGEQIVKDCSLSVAPGSVHVLMGPNGSGKTTLARTLAGDPNCVVASGSIFLHGIDVTTMAPDERARRGLFVSFQQPCAIPGLSVFSFLKAAYHACTGVLVDVAAFRDKLYEALTAVGLDQQVAFRDVNDGFSGGERKRLELAQLLVLKPRVALLDEIDSGLDAQGRATVMHTVARLRREQPETSFFVITHYQELVEQLKPDCVHRMQGGKLAVK